jgi:hypothetical protein
MNIPNNIETSVFVFKHKQTGEIQVTYSPQDKDFENDPKWEHVGTLRPRLWIQAHWEKVDVHTELLERLKGAREWHNGDKWRDGCTIDQRAAWELQRDLLDAAIAKATGAQND